MPAYVGNVPMTSGESGLREAVEVQRYPNWAVLRRGNAQMYSADPFRAIILMRVIQG